jgi:hypothetical protein
MMKKEKMMPNQVPRGFFNGPESLVTCSNTIFTFIEQTAINDYWKDTENISAQPNPCIIREDETLDDSESESQSKSESEQNTPKQKQRKRKRTRGYGSKKKQKR